MTTSAKNLLRSNMKKILHSLSKTSRNEQSHLIFNKLLELDWYHSSKRVGVYLSMFEEVQTDDIVSHILNNGKECFIPWYQGDEMRLVKLKSLDDLDSLPLTKWKIRQPADSDIQLREDALTSGGLDLVLVPGLGFTTAGNRLGRGKGYYDRFLKELKDCGDDNNPSKIVGLAFKEQIVEEIPCNEHDFELDLVIYPD